MYLLQRLKEPSTWAALGILFQVLKGFLPATAHVYADAISAGAGSIAAALPEAAKAS